MEQVLRIQGLALSPELSPVLENLSPTCPRKSHAEVLWFLGLVDVTVSLGRCRRFFVSAGATAGASVTSQVLLRRILAVLAVRWPSG